MGKMKRTKVLHLITHNCQGFWRMKLMQPFKHEHQESIALSSAAIEARNGVTSHRRMARALLTSIPFLISDLVALIGANLLTLTAVSLFPDYPSIELVPMLPLLCGIFAAINVMFGMYPGTGLNPVLELRKTTMATALLYLMFMASSFLRSGGAILLLPLGIACFLTMGLTPLLRSLVRRVFSRFKWWGQPVLVIGEPNSAKFYTKALNSNPRFGLRPVVISDEKPSPVNNETSSGLPETGTKHASSAIRIGDVSHAIVAMPNWHDFEILSEYDGRLSQVVTVPDHSDIPTVGSRMCDLAVLDSFCLKETLLIKSSVIKRSTDLLLISFCALFIMPVVAMIVLMIKLDSQGPLIYGQKRIGRNGCKFRAWKFRTMVSDADQALEQLLATDPKLREEWEMDHKLKKDPRVTKVGRWLRKLSLDELPQLWNVLVGEMSLVGPRPIVEPEIPRYGESFELYKKVLPGLTGLWQVSGRNNTTYSERVQLDNYYSRHWSFWLDLYILARTFKVVFGAQGAY